jgi:NNP family nitrate/nitrite transporter-like MFS transporter
MIVKHNPNYKWYILLLAMLAYGVVAGAARMCMPVLFTEIGIKLNLDATAIGTIWGMDPLAGVFIGLPSGLLADRFGTKRTLTVLCILAGIFGALRGFSTNFITLALTMFLFGLMAAATPNIVPKVTAEWFSGNRLALSNAFLNVAWSIGSMVATQFSATSLSPALGGWRNVLFFYGAPAFALGLLWLFTGREPTKMENPELLTEQIPFKKALMHVLRNKTVWIVGIITFTAWGATMGMVGYLPYYLKNIGWDATSADSTVTVLSLMMCLGSIPMVLLSDKLHTRKGVLMLSLGGMVVALALLPFVDATGVWILIMMSGFLRAGAGSLFNVVIFEDKAIGATYGGTAIGLANSIAMIGAAASPPLGNSLKQYGDGMPFIFWSCLAAVSIALLFLIKTKKNPATPYQR